MKIVWSPTCKALADWLRAHHDDGVSSIGDIGETLGLEKEDYPKLYRCIQYWRRKFLEFYKHQDEMGILKGDKYQKWETAIANFYANYLIQPLFFDQEIKTYYVPNLALKEQITAQRIVHWIKSGQSVMREASTYHETLPSAAEPAQLMGDLKLLRDRVEDGNVPRCINCGQNVQENWVTCPSCGQPR
jgi:hypothetical protein